MGDDTLDPANYETKYPLPGMKVYVVTSGGDSDYAIDGLFSTEKRAQTFIDNGAWKRRGQHSCRINVWTLDKHDSDTDQ